MLSDRSARAIQADQANGQITVTCTGTPIPTATQGTGPTPVPTATSPGGPTPIPGKECYVTVAHGDTLYALARRYNTTVAAFMAANKLSNPNLIYVGQKLLIPGCTPGGGPSPYPTTPPSGKCYTHIVKPGETLYGIALASGDSVAGIASRNKIVNPNLIFVGQRLTVCPGGGSGGPPPPSGKCRYTHVVKPGDTVFRLALLYKTSVRAIAVANNLANPNLIYVGQVLCIP
jgi:peptidoglycan endopeptidase LytE